MASECKQQYWPTFVGMVLDCLPRKLLHWLVAGHLLPAVHPRWLMMTPWNHVRNTECLTLFGPYALDVTVPIPVTYFFAFRLVNTSYQAVFLLLTYVPLSLCPSLVPSQFQCPWPVSLASDWSTQVLKQWWSSCNITTEINATGLRHSLPSLCPSLVPAPVPMSMTYFSGLWLVNSSNQAVFVVHAI